LTDGRTLTPLGIPGPSVANETEELDADPPPPPQEAMARQNAIMVNILVFTGNIPYQLNINIIYHLISF